MYKQCETEQSAARQRELEQGLLEVMLQHRYEDISVSDLCQTLGVPRKTFYRYFSGKDGALYALIDHTFMGFDNFGEDLEMAVKSDAAKQYMEQVFRYWIHCKPLLDALERSGISGLLVQRAIDYSRELDLLPGFLTNRDKQLQKYATMFAVCGMMTMIVQWHHDGFALEPKQMADLAIQLFAKPMFVGIS